MTKKKNHVTGYIHKVFLKTSNEQDKQSKIYEVRNWIHIITSKSMTIHTKSLEAVFSSKTEISMPLNVQLFLSLHNSYIKHKRTTFPTKDLPCLPNQLFQSNNTLTTPFGITHTPNNENTNEHFSRANVHCTNKWFSLGTTAYQ